MNFEYFAARRITASKQDKSSVSAPIIKIAIAAIAVGMIMMLIAVATGTGLQQKIREKVSAFNGHIVISNFDTNFSNDSQIPISMNQSFYPDPGELPGIAHIQITALKGGVILDEDQFEGVVVKGVGKDHDWERFDGFLVDGRLPDFSGTLNDEVLVSTTLANRLGLSLGDRISTFFFDQEKARSRSRGFEIVGLFNSGFSEFDRQYILADIRHIQRLNRWEPNQIGTFELFVEDFDQVQEVGNQVYESIGSELDAQTIRERYYSIFEWLDLFDFNIALIIGIMILVAGINMVTALLVLILERTPMIGILKAMGASDWSIRKIFLYNAAYLIGVGLFWGNLVGIGLLLLQHFFSVFPLDPETYYVSEAPVHLGVGYILLLNLGTLMLCLIMLVVPSWMVTRIKPVKAIRFN